MIRQITDGPHINHPTYFLQSSFFPGDEAMFITSYRTGDAQLFEIDLAGGETRQLTHGAPIHPYSAALHPDGRTLWSRGAGNCGRWTAPRSTTGGSSTFRDAQLGSAPSARTASGSRRPSPGVRARPGGVAFRRPASPVIPFPRTVIHPQFHPLEPEWIEFSGDPAPRMHRVRRDGSGLECLYQHGNDEFIVHETFSGRPATWCSRCGPSPCA